MLKTTKVMTSCIVFSCAAENWVCPTRLAGAKTILHEAISQLIIMTFHKGDSLNFKWPYQAKVIKIFDTKRNTTVNTKVSPLSMLFKNFAVSGSTSLDTAFAFNRQVLTQEKLLV